MTPAPFGLDLEKSYSKPPELPGYYISFNRLEKAAVYIEKSRRVPVETEIQIYFSKQKIVKLIYIYGPIGLDGGNCISFYKKVVKRLNGKYGDYKVRFETKDPIIDDLVLGNKCTHVRIGAYSLKTRWKNKTGVITAELLGDDTGFYIEVEYNFNLLNAYSKNPFKNL